MTSVAIGQGMKIAVIDSGVNILDHHPALELLIHRDGSVAGASGYARLDRRAWSARS